MKFILLFSIAALVGCASIPIVKPDGPGGAVEGIDSTGVIFYQQGKDLWVSENVPAAWFTPDGKYWHLTNLLWRQGQAIRVKEMNP